MAKYLHYKCPDCDGVFRDLQVRADDPPPDRCPLCNSWVSDTAPPEEVFVPQAPAVRSAISRAVDDVYRGTEDASVLRTEMMAQLGGGSASDYNHTKITNLRDHQRPGDVAYVPPPPNPVSELMRTNPNVGGHTQQAQQFAEANRYGVGAYAGEKARQATVSQHRAQLQSIVGAGTLARYKPS